MKETLRKAIEDSGLSQAQCALLLKVDRSQLWHWAYGDRKISPLRQRYLRKEIKKLNKNVDK